MVVLKKKVDLGEYYAIQRSYSKVATVFRISKKEFNEEEEELTIGESERKVVSSRRSKPRKQDQEGSPQEPSRYRTRPRML